MKFPTKFAVCLFVLSTFKERSACAFLNHFNSVDFVHPTYSDTKAKTSRKISHAVFIPTAPPIHPIVGWEDERLSPDFATMRDRVVASVRGVLKDEVKEQQLFHFIDQYFLASNDATNSGRGDVTSETTAFLMGTAIKLARKQLGDDKFKFEVFHRAMKGGLRNCEEDDSFNYFEWGRDFFRQIIDVQNSVVLGRENVKRAFEQVNAGENVVFFANHQSEPDPQVISVLLEQLGYGKEAADMTFIAGHKVTTDPIAIPFSMGRNLVCIHSKKHIDSDAALKPLKRQQNLAAINAVLEMMRKGGVSLWVAPSGGRDRRNSETGQVPIAKFDQKTVDTFRLLGTKSAVPTHYYPLAMVTYDLCPPPPGAVVPGVGERRNFRFSPVGIAVGKEVENVGGVESRAGFTQQVEKACREDYERVLMAIEEKTRGSSQDTIAP